MEVQHTWQFALANHRLSAPMRLSGDDRRSPLHWTSRQELVPHPQVPEFSPLEEEAAGKTARSTEPARR